MKKKSPPKDKDLLVLALVLYRLDRIEEDLENLKGEIQKIEKNNISLPSLKKMVKSTVNRYLVSENSKGKGRRGGSAVIVR